MSVNNMILLSTSAYYFQSSSLVSDIDTLVDETSTHARCSDCHIIYYRIRHSRPGRQWRVIQ